MSQTIKTYDIIQIIDMSIKADDQEKKLYQELGVESQEKQFKGKGLYTFIRKQFPLYARKLVRASDLEVIMNMMMDGGYAAVKLSLPRMGVIEFLK